MRLARWNLTVLMLMWSSSPISAFVFPRATEKHFFFTFCEGLEGLGWRGREGVGREAGEESSGDPGVNERAASNCGVDGLDELLGGGAFEEKTSGACFESPVNVFVGVERGDQNDGDRIADLWSGEQTSGLNAVEVRHSDVE